MKKLLVLNMSHNKKNMSLIDVAIDDFLNNYTYTNPSAILEQKNISDISFFNVTNNRQTNLDFFNNDETDKWISLLHEFQNIIIGLEFSNLNPNHLFQNFIYRLTIENKTFVRTTDPKTNLKVVTGAFIGKKILLIIHADQINEISHNDHIIKKVRSPLELLGFDIKVIIIEDLLRANNPEMISKILAPYDNKIATEAIEF
ncbi:FMN-dependent NADH-azoreductase [Mycoplasma testudineum]|uniref:FMN-dependent NADH-azoreductase n=1 Tax=Mycoplasma testudineum TaxID=244584 RepID=A0A4R6IFM6_9MOLU|nr:hypothetical protein [Mycoplasma testudineum]OYD26899.1 hypothetical protein CG473_00985 [Mycoplasma testudineum]TDO20447.1 FMN-dependent NADH-azoreductase [Mycoplasma testudineum]